MIKKTILVVFVLMLFMVFVACNKEGNIEVSLEPTLEISVEPTGEATTKPSLESTAEPTPKEVLDKDDVGKPQEDAEVLYYDDFVDGYISSEVLFRYNKGHEVVNDQLYLSRYGGENVELVDTYSPDYYCEVGGDYSQFQFHLTFKTSHEKAEKDPWMSTMVGVRVYEALGESSKPNEVNSGLYIALTQVNKLILYHGLPQHWPQGACKVDIPRGFGEMTQLIIVDTGEKIYFYQESEEEERLLFLSVDIGGEILKVFNSANEEVYSADNNLQNEKGGYFKIFNHFGRVVIDSFEIKYR